MSRQIGMPQQHSAVALLLIQTILIENYSFSDSKNITSYICNVHYTRYYTVICYLAVREGRNYIYDILTVHFFSRKHMPILIFKLTYIKRNGNYEKLQNTAEKWKKMKFFRIFLKLCRLNPF